MENVIRTLDSLSKNVLALMYSINEAVDRKKGNGVLPHWRGKVVWLTADHRDPGYVRVECVYREGVEVHDQKGLTFIPIRRIVRMRMCGEEEVSHWLASLKE